MSSLDAIRGEHREIRQVAGFVQSLTIRRVDIAYIGRTISKPTCVQQEPGPAHVDLDASVADECRRLGR